MTDRAGNEQPSAERPCVCVVGAGSSGIAVVKALVDAGIPFDCFEKSDRIGGNWAFRNPNGMSSAYESLHINTSRDRMSYADYPMPPDYPDFPHHSLICEYFDDYVDHFGLRERITFETGVEHADRGDDGVWTVTLDNGEVRRYDALLVANGHHWNPRWPEPPFPGTDTFEGIQMHSHYYLSPDDPYDMKGKRIVVLGMGNSAMDISVELSRPGLAERVFLAARRGEWVIPNYLWGKPLDMQGNDGEVVTDDPMVLMQRALDYEERLVELLGRPEDYGLPKPDHHIFQAHPTISSELYIKLGRGDIHPKPNIEALEGSKVRFVDGTVEDIDLVIYCTGYKVTFPFLDPDLVDAPDNDLPLFRRVFHPDIDNLFFFGLLQPLGAIMPMAERQAKVVADLLRGDYRLPSHEEILADMELERAFMFGRYVPSKRHTMQVDYDPYMDGLAAEWEAGRARAAAADHVLTVPARARATGRNI